MNDWYRQSPALRDGTAFPPHPSRSPAPLPVSRIQFGTPQDEIAFLTQQLAAAIELVRRKDATEADCIARLTALYEPIQQRLQQELKARMRSFERTEKAFLLNAARYETLRAVRVRAMQLGINNLSGEQLDQALDSAVSAKIPPTGVSHD